MALRMTSAIGLSEMKSGQNGIKQGIEVLRIPAKDVLADPDEVADALIRLCSPREPLHHSASLSGAPPHACGAGRSEA